MAAMGSVGLFGFCVQPLNILLLMCCFKNVNTFMDMEELKSIYYGLDILSEPVMLSQETSGGSVQVTSKYGQQYQCTFPDHSEAEKKKEEEEKVAVETGIVEMLKPMKAQGCLVKTKDWWTYEFCYGKSVRQYHMEDGAIKGNVIHLGFYESDFDWSNETAKEERLKMSLASYHSQSFTQGDKCDLTGQPRMVEVRFMCEESSADFVSRIEESETCVYTMTVMTSRICRHPYLRPPVRRRAVPITCSPLLSREEYKDYITELNERKEATMKYKMQHREKKEEDLKKRNFAMDQELEDALVKTARDVLSEPRGSLFPEAGDDGKVSRESFKNMFGPSDQLWELYQRGLELSKQNVEERKRKLEELIELQKKEKTDSPTAMTTGIEGSEQDEEDEEVLSEFTDEIDDIKKRFKRTQKRLSNIKKKLSDERDWETNIEKAIEEAEQELGVKLDRSLVTGLSSTLNKLVNKLQDTENELSSMDEEINGLKPGDKANTMDPAGDRLSGEDGKASGMGTPNAADTIATGKGGDDDDDEDEKKDKDAELPVMKGEGFDQGSGGRWKLDKPQDPTLTTKQSTPKSYDDKIESPPRSSDDQNMDYSDKKLVVPSTFPLPKDPTQDATNNAADNINDDQRSLSSSSSSSVDEGEGGQDQAVAEQAASPVDVSANTDESIPSNIKELLEETVRKEYEKKMVGKSSGKLNLDDDHSFLQDKSIHVIQQEDKDGNTNKFIFVLGFKNSDEEGVEQDRQSALEDNYGFVYNNNNKRRQKNEGMAGGGGGGETVAAVVDMDGGGHGNNNNNAEEMERPLR